MSEWLKEHAWKACVPDKGTVGSNPTLSAKAFHPPSFSFKKRLFSIIYYFLFCCFSSFFYISECTASPS